MVYGAGVALSAPCQVHPRPAREPARFGARGYRSHAAAKWYRSGRCGRGLLLSASGYRFAERFYLRWLPRWGRSCRVGLREPAVFVGGDPLTAPTMPLRGRLPFVRAIATMWK